MRALLLALLLFLAPLGGGAMFLHQKSDQLIPDLLGSGLIFRLDDLQQQVEEASSLSNTVFRTVVQINTAAEGGNRLFRQQQRLLEELLQQSSAQAELSRRLYEKQLLEKLGEPAESYYSPRVAILIFPFNGEDYRGHLAKIRVIDPSALRVTLAHDSYGRLETTSAAARRNGAILAVNGGGFQNAGEAGRTVYYPYGNTVVEGRLVGDFVPVEGTAFFCGFSQYGTLVGGQFLSAVQLMSLQPSGGVSFAPILIRDRRPQPVPPQWRATRHPRTVIGSFPNDEIFIVVVDGRQPGWSSGITMEEIQLRLLDLGAVSAYNLDGGGSSTMFFQGRVLNRPSDGWERAVATHILILP